MSAPEKSLPKQPPQAPDHALRDQVAPLAGVMPVPGENVADPFTQPRGAACIIEGSQVMTENLNGPLNDTDLPAELSSQKIGKAEAATTPTAPAAIPIVRDEDRPRNNLGFISTLNATSGVIQSGKYVVEVTITPDSKYVTTQETDTMQLVVAICEGQFKGRLVVLKFRLRGSPKAQVFIEKEIGLLAKWADAIGAAPSTPQDLQKEFWSKSKKYKITIDLKMERSKQSGVAFYSLTDLEITPKAAGDKNASAEDREEWP